MSTKRAKIITLKYTIHMVVYWRCNCCYSQQAFGLAHWKTIVAKTHHLAHVLRIHLKE